MANPRNQAELIEGAHPKLHLIGIARLATLGEAVDSGKDTEFFSIPTRSLLNRCTSKRPLPFAWTINPYRGCEFACKYCYARYAHEFMEKSPLDFERKIYVKENVAWLLRQELKRVAANEGIAIGTATDPYQPVERRKQLTRSILEVFAETSGHNIGIVTKSNLILRDIDLLKRISERNRLRLHVTVTTMDIPLARKLEPRAPRPDLRMEAVRRLRDAGLYAGVNCAPVLPGITDSPQQLDKVVREAKAADASYVFANPVYLRPCSLAIFMPFLREHFPDLVTRYEECFNANQSFMSKAYHDRLHTLVEALCKKHGLRGRDESGFTQQRSLQQQYRLFA